MDLGVEGEREDSARSGEVWRGESSTITTQSDDEVGGPGGEYIRGNSLTRRADG